MTIFGLLAAAADHSIVLASDLTRLLLAIENPNGSIPFCITGNVSFVQHPPKSSKVTLNAIDDSGGVLLAYKCDNATTGNPSPGERAVFSGIVRLNTNGRRFADCANYHVLGVGAPPPPQAIEIASIPTGHHDFRLARITGTLRDVTLSETHDKWVIVVISSKTGSIYASVPDEPGTYERLRLMIGREVIAIGISTPINPTIRHRIGRTFSVSKPSDIFLSSNNTSAAKDAPDISTITCQQPQEILSLGHHSTIGTVIAAWQEKHLLLCCTNNESYVGVELSDQPLPHYGQTVKVIGLPESDLFRINLVNATWSPIAANTSREQIPILISPNDIVQKRNNHNLVDNAYHGRSIILDGIIRNVPNDPSNRMHVECDDCVVQIDASSVSTILKGLEIGSRVKVCGTCVIEQERRYDSSSFPRSKGFFLVMRKPSDLTLLSKPTWWTPSRLLVVISILTIVLLCAAIWNASLRAIATRKSRELMREQLGHVKAELKTEERTRLAVELHDSLAQNLLGVALEIETATKLYSQNNPTTLPHLETAAKSLQSCRDELRNCLWDLRNRALEAATMDEAIRQTLSPHLSGVDLVVRFNVPRERISDNSTHALLRIIRELTLNGIRHGKATKIWVAGSVEDSKLLFSVRDNGTGFDPEHAPGFNEGHYGLLGIRERIDEFEGEFTIKSTPGKGTRASATLNMPQEEIS